MHSVPDRISVRKQRPSREQLAQSMSDTLDRVRHARNDELSTCSPLSFTGPRILRLFK